MKIKIIISSFLFILIFGIGSHTAQAIEYGQMGGKPTNSDPNIPDSKSWFIYNLDPGTTKEDSLTVVNLFEEEWVALIYAADSIKSSSGGFALKQISEPKEEVGAWVKFYPEARPEFTQTIFEENETIDKACKISEEDLEKKYKLDNGQKEEFKKWCEGKADVSLVLKSGEKKEVPFVITIPQGADVGEHTGGILIQKQSKDESAQGDGSKVLLTTRVGVRIYETVPGQIIKQLSFSKFEIAKNFDEFYWPWDKIKKEKFREYNLTSKINNSGNISVNFKEKITIQNVITRKIETIDDREFQVLRGDDFISSLAWKSPRLAVLNFEKEYRYENAEGQEQIIKADSIRKWFIPWRELVILGFFALILGAIYFFWKKYQMKRYGGIGWVNYTVRENETIQLLSKKFDIDWKTLVKTNKLKVPYSLEAGQVVKVPDMVTDLMPEDSDEDLNMKVDSQAAGVHAEDALVEEEHDDGISIADSLKSAEEENDNIPDEVVESLADIREEKVKENKTKSLKSYLNIDSSRVISEPLVDLEKEKPAEIIAPKKKNQTIINLSNKNREPIAEIELAKEVEEINTEENIITQSVEDKRSTMKRFLIIIMGVIGISLVVGVALVLIKNMKEPKVVYVNGPAVTAESPENNKPAENQVASETKTEEVTELDATKIKIAVLNGGAIAGTAGKVKALLNEKKYENVEAGNAEVEGVAGTTIYYSDKKLEKEAHWMKDLLAGIKIIAEIKEAATDEEKSGEIVIILGK